LILYKFKQLILDLVLGLLLNFRVIIITFLHLFYILKLHERKQYRLILKVMGC